MKIDCKYIDIKLFLVSQLQFIHACTIVIENNIIVL